MSRAGWLLGMFVLGHSMIFLILYAWSRRNPEAPVGFFGFRFSGLHLPWVMTLFTPVQHNQKKKNIRRHFRIAPHFRACSSSLLL